LVVRRSSCEALKGLSVSKQPLSAQALTAQPALRGS